MNRDRIKWGLAALVVITGLTFAALSPASLPENRPAERVQKLSTVDLASLLEKTAEYSRRLESSALYFVCREEISEKIDPALDAPPPPAVKTWSTADSWSGMESRGAIAITAPLSKIKRSYVYEYQCVRKDGRFQEVRTLLEENGKKMNEPNAKLKTSIMFYENAMLGPAGIFRKEYQAEFDYAILGTDKFEKKPVVVIDAKPKPGAPEVNTLYGKVWVDPSTGNIVKIEYCENRIGHYEVFEARGIKYNRKPRITQRAEFSPEKNGLRFPSKLYIEEAYLNARGRVFVRSETTVVYKDFKFFTVEVDVR